MWGSVTAFVMIVAAIVGWFRQDFDVFLYTGLAGYGVIFVLTMVFQTWKEQRAKEALKQYKPYQLRLLGSVVLEDYRTKLEPMKRSHPYWEHHK